MLNGFRLRTCLESFQKVFVLQLFDDNSLSAFSKYSVFDLRISVVI